VRLSWMDYKAMIFTCQCPFSLDRNTLFSILRKTNHHPPSDCQFHKRRKVRQPVSSLHGLGFGSVLGFVALLWS
jgi:hypothetical protein